MSEVPLGEVTVESTVLIRSVWHDTAPCSMSFTGERIFIERMPSDRKPEASREGSK